MAIGAACPVRREAPGQRVIAILCIAKRRILPVQRIRFPAGIGAVEVRVILEDAEQYAVDLFTAQCQGTLRGLAGGEGIGHGAGRIQRILQLGLDGVGPGLGQVLDFPDR
ncbi:hypothetical protein D9M69_698210 [compost metagenome]